MGADASKSLQQKVPEAPKNSIVRPCPQVSTQAAADPEGLMKSIQAVTVQPQFKFFEISLRGATSARIAKVMAGYTEKNDFLKQNSEWQVIQKGFQDNNTSEAEYFKALDNNLFLIGFVEKASAAPISKVSMGNNTKYNVKLVVCYVQVEEQAGAKMTPSIASALAIVSGAIGRQGDSYQFVFSDCVAAPAPEPLEAN
mgnify:FL=1